MLLTCYTLIPIIWNDQKEFFLGLSEAAFGIGCTVGPPLGSFAYNLFDFDWAFYAFSIMIALDGLAIFWYVPDKLNYVSPNLGNDNKLLEENETPQQDGATSTAIDTN